MFHLLLLICSSLVLGNPCLQKNISLSRGKVCRQIFKFDSISRVKTFWTDTYCLQKYPVSRGIPQVYSRSRGLRSTPPSSKFDCQNIECICGVFLNGVCKMPDGGTYMKSFRKEFRMLSDAERFLYTQAFWSVQPDVYNMLSTIHGNANTSLGAHSGPNFCPWHREMLKRTKQVDGKYPFVSVSLPYWDSSIDNDIYELFKISPANSVMFCEEMLGTQRNGTLDDGLFANFVGTFGPTKRDLDRWPGILYLLRRDDMDAIMKRANVNDVLGATAGDSKCPTVPIDNIELLHGDVHVWMGGDMEDVSTSSNDPIFFLHHNFIDFVFENWRQNRLTRDQREVAWNTGSPDCYSPAHRVDAVMVPFGPKTNLDGMSNSYTDNLYNFQARPTCNKRNPCASKYLWCNLASGYCVARLRPLSPCYTYYGVDPCYNSICQNRQCR